MNFWAGEVRKLRVKKEESNKRSVKKRKKKRRHYLEHKKVTLSEKIRKIFKIFFKFLKAIFKFQKKHFKKIFLLTTVLSFIIIHHLKKSQQI